MDKYTDPRFTESDAAIIRRIARRMYGHYGYGLSDVEDIEQELALHISQVSHRYDPTRSPRRRFVSKAAKNKLLNLIERRIAQKRNESRNVAYDDSTPAVLNDGSATQAQIVLHLDMKAGAERLPHDVRQALDLLLAGHSERDLERLMGLTRGQVRTLIKRMACILRKAGLDPNQKDEQPFWCRFR